MRYLGPGSLEDAMLYLSRKVGEAVIVNNEIEIRVVAIRGRSVKLGFHFPPTASVLREEVFRQIERENAAAAATVRELEQDALGLGARDGTEGGDEPGR